MPNKKHFSSPNKIKINPHYKNISVKGCAAWVGRVGDWQAGVCAQWVVGLPGSEWAGVCVRVAGGLD